MTLRGPITVFELNQSDLPGAIASVGNGGRYRDVGITHTVFGVSSLTASDKFAQFLLRFHPHFLVMFISHRIFLPFSSDRNECIENPGICNPGQCIDTLGSYRCICPNGFKVTRDQSMCVGKTPPLVSHLEATL